MNSVLAKDAVVDRIVESAYAADWEKQNADSFDSYGARSDLAKAEYHLGQAYMFISQAAAKTEGTPYDQKVMELLEKLEEFRSEKEKVEIQIERRELD